MTMLHGVHGAASDIPALDDWSRNVFADYSGSDRKDGLIAPNGDRYLIKYSEQHSRVNDLDTSYVNNVLSEYIASHVLALCGFDAHETRVATRGGELIVACRDFTDSDTILIEFGRYMRKHYDSGDLERHPSLEQIRRVLSTDPDLSGYAQTLYTSFAERFVGDALVGNFDRHMGNWGYLVSRRDGSLRPSPMYDNGSTLCPALPDRSMAQMLEDRHAIAQRTLLFPTAALTLRKGWPKVNYRDMLISGFDDAFSLAVCRVVPAILEAMPRIEQFIDEQAFLSETRRRFYRVMLRARTALILRPAYEACNAKAFDTAARERLEKGQAYTQAHFERDYQAVAQSPAWDDILG